MRLRDVFGEVRKLKRTGRKQPSPFFHPVQMQIDELFKFCSEGFENAAEVLELNGAPNDASRVLLEAPSKPNATDWLQIQQLAETYLFLKLDEYSDPMQRPVVLTATEVAVRNREVARVKTPLAKLALILKSEGLEQEAGWLKTAAWHWEVKVDEKWPFG